MAFVYHHYYLKHSQIDQTETLSTDQYKIIEMNNRNPIFKLATMDGKQPYADGDIAQIALLESLQLTNQCHQDPSLLVVDVGAFLGDFGLYAAACGCQVYLFEVQADMVALIQKSIQLNNFSTSRVRVFRKAVSDLPSNSEVTFSGHGGTTTLSNGTLKAKTIRLDDVSWPIKAKIFMLKIDVEGFELHVLRSATNLFKQNRIHHLIFEYTAWWTDRAPQTELIPYVEKILGAKQMYALDRVSSNVYGPLGRKALDIFYHDHIFRHLQTDIYAIFLPLERNSTMKTRPYISYQSFA